MGAGVLGFPFKPIGGGPPAGGDRWAEKGGNGKQWWISSKRFRRKKQRGKANVNGDPKEKKREKGGEEGGLSKLKTPNSKGFVEHQESRRAEKKKELPPPNLRCLQPRGGKEKNAVWSGAPCKRKS